MEFSYIGDYCQYCKQYDFLPVNCDKCKKKFCQSHCSYENHKCQSLNNHKKRSYTREEIYRKNNTIRTCRHKRCSELSISGCRFCHIPFCSEHIITSSHSCHKFNPKKPSKIQIENRMKMQRIINSKLGIKKEKIEMNKRKNKSMKLEFINSPIEPISSVLENYQRNSTIRIVMGIIYPFETNYHPAFNFFEGFWKVGKIVDLLMRQCDVDVMFSSSQDFRIYHLRTGKCLPNNKSLRELIHEGVVFQNDILILERYNGENVSNKIWGKLRNEVSVFNDQKNRNKIGIEKHFNRNFVKVNQ